ncbi:MAG TPA: zf-HC2 domain-containing protein, partial [Methylomirabilota bacterium]|nr:zf-HC2 domain-containing protein [Methylomirabilota bacterium]
MNCHEAREWFPALLAGEISLTEAVLVEAHLGQCAECRHALEQLDEKTAPRRAGWLHAPVAPLSEPPDPAPSAGVPPRHRLLPVTVFRLSAIAVSLMLVTALGIHLAGRSLEPEVEVPHAAAPPILPAEPPPPEPAPKQSAPATPPPTAAPKVSPTPPTEPKASPPTSAAARPKAPAAAPLALPPRPERPVVAGSANSQLEKAAPTPAPKPLPKSDVTAAVKPNGREAAPSQSAAPAPAPGRAPASEPASAAPDSAADVVMQLAVRDRSTAMRDLRSLLTRLGGTAHGRDQGATIVVV